MSKAKWILIASILLASLTMLQGFKPVMATGEQFSLSATPNRVVEGYAPGIHLLLLVSNAQIGAYSFNWTVVDPSGKSTFITKNTPSTASSWNETATYPSDFSAALSLVGTYRVNIAEITPSLNESVQTTTFQVGLTDSPVYQRNSIVQITGSGYIPLDTVSINIVQGSTSASGFPRSITASTSGIVSLSWQTYPNTATSNYNISLAGTSTPAKSPQDIQQFTLNPTNTTTNSLFTKLSTVTRTGTVVIKFNATYLNATPATTGSAQIRLTEPDGVALHSITASYDNMQQTFAANYTTTLASTMGAWSATLGKDAYVDGYGNSGPLSSVSSTFTITVATLTVSNQPENATYYSGNTVPIVSRILTPAGTDFTQGTVTAEITVSGRSIAAPIGLVFDLTQGKWTGSYKVNATDPSGTWLLTVIAQDAYGNSGQTTSTFNVSTPGPPNPIATSLATWAWLLAILGVVGLGFAILIFKTRSVSHREVKLDLKAIHGKAEEVKNDDFLQSIKNQLKRRTDMMKSEKKAAEEKHD